MTVIDPLRAGLETSGWLSGWWLLLRPRALPPTGGGGEGLSIIVPARDEEERLAPLLASLAGTSTHEVLIVDDHSADGTADAAKRAGFTVAPAPPVPPGWTGKAWACRYGASVTSAPLLLFLDADVRLAPGALGRIIGLHSACDGLVSVQPWNECVRPGESLAAFFNAVALMGAGVGSSGSATAAFGPVIACRRQDYERVGGHRCGDVLDDVALARRFRAAGLPVTCRLGAQAVTSRMYPGGARAVADGFTKNIARGAVSATRPVPLLLTVLWLFAMVTLLSAGPVLKAVAYVAFAGQLGYLLRRIGGYRWWAWAAWPVPLAFFVVVFLRSLLHLVLGREAQWRGRRVRV